MSSPSKKAKAPAAKQPNDGMHGGTDTVGTNVGKQRYIDKNTLTLDPVTNVTAAHIDTTQQDEFRTRQLALADQLMAQTQGQGPSVAELQLKQGTDRAIASQFAFANSVGGGNPLLARRQAAINSAGLEQGAVNQAAQVRMAEALNAQNLLKDVTGTGRQQDITLADDQASLNQQAALANAGAANQRSLAQGTIFQNVELANQSAYNTRNLTQAQINSALMQSRISAAATTAAAGAAASASRYGTDASNYRFNAQLAFDEDRYYGGAANGAAGNTRSNNIGNINAQADINNQRSRDLDNTGGNIARGVGMMAA